MGDCSDEIDDTLRAAMDRSAIGRRLYAGASVEAAIPPEADRLAALIEYALPMLTGMDQGFRTLAFEIDELAAEHHRLAEAVEQLSNELQAGSEERQ